MPEAYESSGIDPTTRRPESSKAPMA